MEVLQIWLNKERGTIEFFCDDDNIKGDYVLIVSDVHLDCSYYSCDIYVHKGFSMWVAPFTHKLNEIVLGNKKFAGYTVKILNKANQRIVQTKKLFLHDSPPVIKTPFYTHLTDVTGPSYVDFFFGDLCSGLDCSGVVVDAGANVGFFSLYAKENGAKRIYCIEPDPMPFFYLEKNFGTDPAVIPINKAMYVPTDQPISFDISSNDSVGSTLTKNNNDNWGKDKNYHHTFHTKITTQIPSISVQDILKIEEKIDLLKLDIEGAEFDVIEQLEPEYWNRINRLFIEYHGRPDPIEEKLKEQGYSIEYRHRDDQWVSGSIGFIYAQR